MTATPWHRLFHLVFESHNGTVSYTHLDVYKRQAWLQVYVPGPGWVDFDPSRGIVGNENLVRVAVAPHPREAIPVQGTWFGTATDHLAMKVAVKVATAAATGA